MTDPTKYNLVRDESLAGEKLKISRFVDNLTGDSRCSFFEELKQQATPMPSTTPLKTSRSAAFCPFSPEVYNYIPKENLDDLASTRLRRLNAARNRRLLNRMRSTSRKFQDLEFETALNDLQRRLGDASTETSKFSRVQEDILPDETLDTSRTEEQDTSQMSRIKDDILPERTKAQDTTKSTEERKVP